MPKFSIKDLLIATSLVAFGSALISAAIVRPNPGPQFAVTWYGGGMLIGAGLFFPFRAPWIGVYVGVIVQFGLLAIR